MDFQSQNRRARPYFACAIVLAALLPLQLAHAQTQTQPSAQAQPATGGTLDRVRTSGKLVLGYRADNQPMSYRDGAGQPAGFAVAVCLKVADGLKAQLQLPTLAVEWVAVSAATALQDVQQRKVDLLCSAEAATLAQRTEVSFSEPFFLTGISALVSSSAPAEFQHILESRPPPYKPMWRGTVPTVLQHRTLSVVAGTPAVALVGERVRTFKLITTVSTEENYAAGVAKVAKGNSDALFGDRAQLLALAKQHPDAGKMKVLNRHFTYEPLALALPRNDDDFRLAVDRALEGFMISPKFGELYIATFGAADSDTVEFFRSTLR